MTVPIATSRSTYTGNAATTVFSTGFYFLDPADVVVKLTPSGGVQVVQTLGVHYTVTKPAAVGANGAITMLTAPPASSALVIERTVPIIQDTSFRTQGSFSPAVHEDRFDEQTFIDQQLTRRIADLESAGAAGSVVAGNGLTFSGATLHVGAGAGVQANADDIAVLYGGPADIAAVTAAPAAEGTANTAARTNHKHDISTAAAGAIAIGDAADVGVATSLARSDHRHSVAAPAAPADVTKAPAGTGAAATFARADHKHDVTTAVALELTDSANAEGNATSLSRSNHTHAHGVRSGGTLHAVATKTDAGFMSAADKTKLDGLLAETVSQGDIKTTDATPTQVLEWTPADDTAENVDLRVVALKAGSVDTGGYHLRLTVRRIAGVTSIIDQDRLVPDHESAEAAAWDVTVAASSPKILVTVTGTAASNIWWLVQARRLKCGVAGP